MNNSTHHIDIGQLLESLRTYCKDEQAFGELSDTLHPVLEKQNNELTRLGQEEQYLRLVLDLDPSFIFARNKEGRFVLANQAIADAYGIAAKDMLGKKDEDFMDDLEAVRQILSDDLEVLETWENKIIPEKRIVDVHEKERWLRILKSPLVSQTGEVEQVLAVAVDITAYKEAELQLSRKERRYETLVHSTSDVVWVTNRDGIIVENQISWGRFTGQTGDESLGEGWFNAVHVDDRERMKKAWFRAVHTQTHFSGEFRLRRSDYSYHYLQLNGIPVEESEGNTIEWVGFGVMSRAAT